MAKTLKSPEIPMRQLHRAMAKVALASFLFLSVALLQVLHYRDSGDAAITWSLFSFPAMCLLGLADLIVLWQLSRSVLRTIPGPRAAQWSALVIVTAVLSAALALYVYNR